MEFVPVDTGAVSHGDAVGLPRALRARLPRVLVKFLDPLVGGRVPGGPRDGLGMFGPVAAPPADRLDPANQPQPTVPAEHVANARVPRLDQVVRRRNRLDTAPGGPRNANGWPSRMRRRSMRRGGRTNGWRTPRTPNSFTDTWPSTMTSSRSLSFDHGTQDIRECSFLSGEHIRTPRNPYKTYKTRPRTQSQTHNQAYKPNKPDMPLAKWASKSNVSTNFCVPEGTSLGLKEISIPSSKLVEPQSAQ